MEQRSAAALGEGNSSEEEQDFEEGYETEQLLLAVRQDDLQQEEPRLQVTRTRAQRLASGEALAVCTIKCKNKDCLYCPVKDCFEVEEPNPCIFCSQIRKPELCLRKGICSSWSMEQRETLSVARGIQEALMKEQAVQQLMLPATATSTPRREAYVGIEDASDRKRQEEERTKHDDDPEQPIQVRIEARSGTKPRMAVEQQRKGRGPKSLASRPFVDRWEENNQYFLRLDLNQLTFPFKPEEFLMTTRGNRLAVKALHQPSTAGAGNTPTRSEEAGKSWYQEFELPAGTSEMVVSCVITQDNLALLCFEEKKTPHHNQEQATENPAPKVTASEKDADPVTEREQMNKEVVHEGRGEKEMQEWQRRAIEDIVRLQEELRQSFHPFTRQLLDQNLPAKVGLGSRAISPERMEVGEETNDNEIYRDRWEKARSQWRGQGIPQFPGRPSEKKVHWPEEKNMEESFYSMTETPLTSRYAAPRVDMPQKTILAPARLNYLDRVRPWDRGGEMFQQETKEVAQVHDQVSPLSLVVPTHQHTGEKQPNLRTQAGVFLTEGVTPPRRLFDNPPNYGSFTSPLLSSSQLTPNYADLQFPQPTQHFSSRSPSAPRSEMGRPTSEQEADSKRERQHRASDREQGNTPQLAEVLTLLTDRLTTSSGGNKSSERHSSLKLPSVSLPRCKFDSQNQTSARQWYTFKHALYNCVAQHKLDTKILLLHYATDNRLLPATMQEAFQNSETLEEALKTIGSRFPPLNSLHAELVKEMLSFPPLEATSEKAKILRCSKILTTVEDFLRFFQGEPSLDISRDKILFILHNLTGQQEYKQEILREVSIMDKRRQEGQLYANSLKDFLLRYRLLYIDLHSALCLVGNHTSTKHRSAAVKTREKKSDGPVPVESKGNCDLCLTKPHKNWQCFVELKKVASGARTLPSHICAACLNVKKTGHPQKCSIVRTKQKGVFYLYQNMCPKCSVNIKICPCEEKAQKRVDPDQNEKTLKSGSAAFRIRILEENEQEDEWEGETDDEAQVSSSAAVQDDLGRAVVFLTEEVLVLGHDNQTKKIIVSYDSHSSSHHCTKDLGSEFNWGEEGNTQPVAMLTVAGQITSQMLVFKLKLLTLQGILPVTALEGTWSDTKDEPQLDQALAAECNIALPGCEGGEEASPRLILGCGEIIRFPKRIPTPTRLAEKHSKLAVFCSQLTGNLLVCGQLDRD